ncbi:MAG TPA: hypothetical protein VFE70_08625 [Candidatus Elarobacter sp.]|nr:hypothetical protein [Candidatus Elarobacter sp.]
MKLCRLHAVHRIATSVVAGVATALLAVGQLSAATYSPGFMGGDKFTPQFGGSGGGTFQARCADPMFLVGLEVTQDSRIKSVRPLCATLQGDHFGAPLRSPLEFGQPTTNRYSRVCPNGGSPDAISVQADGYGIIGVWAIDLRCADARGVLPIGDPARIDFTGSMQPVTATSIPKQAGGNAECPQGYITKGVFGRYGIFIDAIGLICGWPGPPPVSNSAPAPAGTCVTGFVWRNARPSDHVCVTTSVRIETAADNAAAASRRVSPPDPTCIQGYVWREAFVGDTVCVRPVTRDQIRADNSAAPGRIAH